ncbi:hypothetical protein PUN28_002690 [Cardiocondyla obscurior]|uniref:Uncharacterized protein n=1 Tax=Cardiocondyla obscurior TaxID=286306 RepID=A0AAW2GVU5_9HYME
MITEHDWPDGQLVHLEISGINVKQALELLISLRRRSVREVRAGGTRPCGRAAYVGYVVLDDLEEQREKVGATAKQEPRAPFRRPVVTYPAGRTHPGRTNTNIFLLLDE